MSKFKIRFKLEGLELEVEGTRDDVPLITEQVGRQLAQLMAPAVDIVEGTPVDVPATILAPPTNNDTTKPRKKRASSKGGASTANAKSKDSAIDFRHDPTKWGSPRQTWSTAQKSLWLLLVVKNDCSVAEMSAGVISATFNKHFRQAGTVLKHNVTRDLGRLKTSTRDVGEDTTKDPSAWYLTDSGEAAAKALVTEALSPTPAQ